MKHNLGISVYPDLKPLSEIREYMKLASQHGVTRVFSSMFSVEGSKETVLSYFREMIKDAHEFGLQVSLDVNPMCFEKMEATVDDLTVFADINVDILRMDLSFGPEGDLKIINNPHGITIEFNSSITLTKELLNVGAKPKKFLMCHNFYPQRYTGLKWQKFLDINKGIKSLSRDVRIGAFVSSNAENTHGVWEAVDGLPTVEKLRGLPIDLQMRLLLATGDVDDILIGNAYASEKEFKTMQAVLRVNEAKNDDPIIKMLSDYGLFNLETSDHKKIKVTLDKDISETEKSILLDFYPHMSWGDSSEWIWRTRLPRFTYSQDDKTIPCRSYDKEMFEVGDVVIVNDNYKHYAGELQIVLLPIVNDKTRNLVGHIDEEEYLMMEFLHDFDVVFFQEK